ncbi:hypothetical protein HK101_002927 [Irineochytrium annulatum]|nr:hypothetical protein HK101_002927 [Irineochytrium annulatum]
MSSTSTQTIIFLSVGGFLLVVILLASIRTFMMWSRKKVQGATLTDVEKLPVQHDSTPLPQLATLRQPDMQPMRESRLADIPRPAGGRTRFVELGDDARRGMKATYAQTFVSRTAPRPSKPAAQPPSDPPRPIAMRSASLSRVDAKIVEMTNIRPALDVRPPTRAFAAASPSTKRAPPMPTLVPPPSQYSRADPIEHSDDDDEQDGLSRVSVTPSMSASVVAERRYMAAMAAQAQATQAAQAAKGSRGLGAPPGFAIVGPRESEDTILAGTFGATSGRGVGAGARTYGSPADNSSSDASRRNNPYQELSSSQSRGQGQQQTRGGGTQGRAGGPQFCDSVKSLPDAPLLGHRLFHKDSNFPDTTRHYAISLLEQCLVGVVANVKKNKTDLGPVHTMRSVIVDLFSNGTRDMLLEKLFIKEKVVHLFTDAVKRLWPDHWPDLDAALMQLYYQSHRHQELVLMVHKALSEDVFTYDDDVVNRRKKELTSAMFAVMMTSRTLHTLYGGDSTAQGSSGGGGVVVASMVLRVIRAEPEGDGWLARWIKGLRTHFEAWVEESHIIPSLYLSDLQAACEALFSVFDRTIHPDEMQSNVVILPMFGDENLLAKLFLACARLYGTDNLLDPVVMNTTILSSESYDFLKILVKSNLVVGINIPLVTYALERLSVGTKAFKIPGPLSVYEDIDFDDQDDFATALVTYRQRVMLINVQEAVRSTASLNDKYNEARMDVLPNLLDVCIKSAPSDGPSEKCNALMKEFCEAILRIEITTGTAIGAYASLQTSLHGTLMEHPNLLLQTLHKMFTFASFALPQDSNKERNVRGKVLNALVKMGMAMPDILINLYNDFVATITILIKDVKMSGNDRMRMVEFLVVIIYFSSASEELKAPYFDSIISPVLEEWAEWPQARMRDPKQLMDFLGGVHLWVPYSTTILEKALMMTRCCHDLYGFDEWKTLPPEFASILDVASVERRMLTTGDNKANHTNELEHFIHKTRSWLDNMREGCYNIIGHLTALEGCFYEIPNVIPSLVECLFVRANVMNNRHLKSLLTCILDPLLRNCPMALTSDVYTALLPSLFEFMNQRLSSEWALAIKRGIKMGTEDMGDGDTDGDDASATDEIIAEKLLRELTRAYIGVIVDISNVPIQGMLSYKDTNACRKAFKVILDLNRSLPSDADAITYRFFGKFVIGALIDTYRDGYFFDAQSEIIALISHVYQKVRTHWPDAYEAFAPIGVVDPTALKALVETPTTVTHKELNSIVRNILQGVQGTPISQAMSDESKPGALTSMSLKRPRVKRDKDLLDDKTSGDNIVPF